MFKLDLEKAEEPELKLPTSLDHRKSNRIPEKKIYFHTLTSLKSLTVWITINCREFFKSWAYQTTLMVSWETCRQVKKQQLELDMEQQTGSKLGKEYDRAVYCHLSIQLICRIYHTKCWARWVTSWNKDCLEKFNNLRCTDDTTLMAESKEELKNLLMKVKEQSEKLS